MWAVESELPAEGADGARHRMGGRRLRQRLRAAEPGQVEREDIAFLGQAIHHWAPDHEASAQAVNQDERRTQSLADEVEGGLAHACARVDSRPACADRHPWGPPPT